MTTDTTTPTPQPSPAPKRRGRPPLSAEVREARADLARRIRRARATYTEAYKLDRAFSCAALAASLGVRPRIIVELERPEKAGPVPASLRGPLMEWVEAVEAWERGQRDAVAEGAR